MKVTVYKFSGRVEFIQPNEATCLTDVVQYARDHWFAWDSITIQCGSVTWEWVW
jgi:hypothetical protein